MIALAHIPKNTTQRKASHAQRGMWMEDLFTALPYISQMSMTDAEKSHYTQASCDFPLLDCFTTGGVSTFICA